MEEKVGVPIDGGNGRCTHRWRIVLGVPIDGG